MQMVWTGGEVGMRLIDADALKRAIATMMPSRVEVNFVVDNQPDAIVRCKDCKHGEKVPTFKYYPNVTWCNKYLTSHNDNWFCADGERRTDESISDQ